MNILLLGAPGAGKGTQGERIADQLKLRKIATGDVLRAAVRAGTEQGRAAKAFMDRGDLVPDAVILGIMKEALAEPASANGVILDGVVRTVPQAEGLQKVLQQLGRTLDVVLMLDVADDEIVKRLGGRTVCEVCQTPYTGREPGTPCDKNDGGMLARRKDDDPDAIRTRMKAFRESTAPVIAWYMARTPGEGRTAAGNAGAVGPDSHKTAGPRFLTIDAAGELDDVTQRIMQALKS
ncbi:MAG: nucleoside monophosphate kinase [Gemmatimonadota bacterium]|nr:nucleoside monophosphate kinase [Gemmatimonadota bacterium]